MNKKIVIIAGIISVALLALAGLFVFVFVTSPHMKVQPHVRAFQMEMPPLPEGVVTVEVPATLPTAGEAAGLANPLPASRENIMRGRVYYHYYCLFCHGEEGKGDGPVGESYVPVPTDLESAKIAGYKDGVLLRAMLTGIGHDPVLERVVPPQHRWYLVLYVRSLKGSAR